MWTWCGLGMVRWVFLCCGPLDRSQLRLLWFSPHWEMMGSTLMYIPGSRNRQAMEKKTWFVGNVVPVVALKSMVDHHFPHEKCHFCFIHNVQTSPNVDKVDVNNFPMKIHQETSTSFRDFPRISHGFPMDFQDTPFRWNPTTAVERCCDNLGTGVPPIAGWFISGKILLT